MKWCFSLIGVSAVAWQIEATRALFGQFDVDTGNRQFTKAFISMAKKNAKSFWCGWATVYHLDQEHEIDKRALGIATNRKQAAEVFDSAAMVVQRNPTLLLKFEVLNSQNSKVIRHRQNQARYEVLSADGKRNDGARGSMVLVDEIHRFHTPSEEQILDVVRRAMRGKKDPLEINITTAGDPTASRIWRAEYEYAKRIKDGTIKNPRYYVQIHEADPEKLKADPEYWKTRAARTEANPAHEDHEGGWITDAELVEDMQRAIEIPTERPKYWRFTLNAMAESDSKMFAELAWKACSDETRALVGRRCYIGVDLSTTTDLTALALLFPNDDGSVDVVPYFFCPSERVAGIARALGPWGEKFKQWVREGDIKATPGPTVDYAAVKERIMWARDTFDVVEVVFDKHEANQFMVDLDGEGLTIVDQPQGYWLSAAIKDMQARVLNRNVRHGGHEVLAWNAACAKVQQNTEERYKVIKADRAESTRIDGIAAMATAWARMMMAEKAAESVPMAIDMSGWV